jgi:hypothetical protein
MFALIIKIVFLKSTCPFPYYGLIKSRVPTHVRQALHNLSSTALFLELWTESACLY